MDRVAGGIRTPDQRLRVFVSSTLKELAPERRAARAAIERLSMAPVMFELGARPHPPRSLYRAYLEQSDIFVGIYGEQYGWIAPGEDVSGLEDEWNLAPDIPKLVYLKRSERRDDRLEGLIARIRADDHASYASFTDAAELGDLVAADLASLLAERFDAADPRRKPFTEPAPQPASTESVRLPSPLTRLLGRDAELATVTRMLADDGHRLVTLTGPGGIGKSRLAIAAARAVEASFPDGVVFVDLAPVVDPGLVITTVASTLGIGDTGEAPIAETLRVALADRRMLLVVDNVEQVVEAAPALAALLGATEVSMLATSRILLRVGGEQSIELGPLPPEAAIDLLVERARAVKPDFELTDSNAAQVAAICTALDCAPLALELAAARLRVLTPAALGERLDHALSLLTGGARDLPERQRTLRATIDWSAQLLREQERELLLRLGVFRSGFGLDAAEWMADGLGDVDAMDALAALIDGSLVREQDRGDRAWYTMLATVREYGRERLEERGILTATEERHARFYAALGDTSSRPYTWMDQITLMSRLADERDELRAAVDHFLATAQFRDLAELVWHLHWFWWVGGQLGEVHGWMSRMLESGAELDERSRTIARFYSSSIRFGEATDAAGVAVLADCVAYFHRTGDVYGETLSRVMLAVAQLSLDPPELDSAEANLERGLELAEDLESTFGRTLVRIMLARAAMARGQLDRAFGLLSDGLAIARAGGDRLGEAIALNHLGWERLLSDDVEGARTAFVEQLDISSTFGHEEGFAYGLEAMSAVAAVTGDLERSGVLFGAAENVRERKGLATGGSFSLHGRILEQALDRGGADGTRGFERGRRTGRSADLADMVALALAAPESQDSSAPQGAPTTLA
ncbi:DUF4062 domain-containing protein [Agromyces sp. NPDC004153]